MKQVGFVKDKNVKVIYQWAKHDLNRLPDLARKLVDAGVDVLAATGGHRLGASSRARPQQKPPIPFELCLWGALTQSRPNSWIILGGRAEMRQA